jgi:hypothetical protein
MAPNILKRSLVNFKNITKGMFSLNEGLSRSQKYTANISKDLLKSSENKKKYLREGSFSFKRKIEASRRKKSEGIIELSKVGAVFRAPGRVIADTTQGFFSRILNFAGTIMAGWMIYNLPSIIGMAQELGSRSIRLTQILQSFAPNALSILGSFGDVIGSYITNFASFDFQDSSNRVENSMKNLNTALSGLQSSFDEVIQLFTTPLTKGLEGREDSPELGTDYSRRSSGTGGQLQPIHKQALDIISGPESGGNYNAMNQGTDSSGNIIGSGDSSKIIGKPLTSMTIGEVMDRQDESKYPRNARPDRGIHAAGRYQIIGSTMKVALKESGLSKNDMFSPENQDLLGIAVLKSQGPGAWTKYSKYSKQEIDIMYKAKNTPLGQPSAAKPQPTPPQPSPVQPSPRSTGTMDLVPQTGPGGFIQGGSSDKSETAYATHFHIDLKTPNYTQQGLLKIREVAFQAVKAMQARGSYVTFGNIQGYPVASKNDSILRSQILQEQQGHGSRSSPGVDVQEHNSKLQRTFPSQPGSKTTFPFAVGAVYWRGGYGREAEIIGSNGVTVSHGAPGSRASDLSQQPQQPAPPPAPSAKISPTPRQPIEERIVPESEQESYVVPFAYPQSQPQTQVAIPSKPQTNINMSDTSLNRFITKKLLLDLAYT